MEEFMPTKSLLFTTGQFARLHHLNKRTLHYYDEIGLFSPAFKGENDYRYYTWQQSADLENILALRELHMSIDEIRSYLHSPNAQSFLALSERKIGEIDETIRRLTKLRAIMQKKQEMLHLSMQIKDGQIDTVQCEEEYLFITPLPPSEPLPEQKQMQMDTLLSHLQTAWDLSEYKACSPAWSSLHKSVVFTENLPGFTCALSVWAAGTGFPHSMAGCWPLPGKKAGSFRGIPMKSA